MARLRQAGLNPNLVYQDGAASLSAESPEMTAGKPQQPIDVAHSLGYGAASSKNASLIDSQIQLNEARADELGTRSMLNEANIKRSLSQAGYYGTQADYYSKILPNVCEQLKAQVKELNANTDYLTVKSSEISVDVARKVVENKVFYDNLTEYTKTLQSQMKMTQDQAHYFVAKMLADIGLLKAETVEALSNAEKNSHMNRFYDEYASFLSANASKVSHEDRDLVDAITAYYNNIAGSNALQNNIEKQTLGVLQEHPKAFRALSVGLSILKGFGGYQQQQVQMAGTILPLLL